jgi:hypothetical protein
MKNCPFCKNAITENNDTCPHCHRVLVERIGTPYRHQSQTVHQDTKSSTSKSSKVSFDRLTKNFNWNNFKKYVPILALVLIIFFISIQKDNNHTYPNYNPTPISVIPENKNNGIELTNTPETPKKDPKNYVSLPSGTIFSKNSYYLNGLGKLQIKNGTSLDAIVKLVNTTINKSVFTVYIKANSTYTIDKVKDGNYKLFFNLGNDWDTEVKAFAVNSGYEVFEDLFDFTTREYEEGDYIRTKYSTFEVTLNPVIGGTAETENVNVAEFANY